MSTCRFRMDDNQHSTAGDELHSILVEKLYSEDADTWVCAIDLPFSPALPILRELSTIELTEGPRTVAVGTILEIH